MDLKDVALLVSTFVAIASIVGTLVTSFTQLSVKNEVAGVNNVVANWRAEAFEERNQDKEDLKKWIEERFLPSREADSRLKRLEEDHRSLNSKQDSFDVRLRHIEAFNSAAPRRNNSETRQ